MIIGLPKETKHNEYRVAITPGGIRQLVDAGHDAMVQIGAGAGSGFSDEEYGRAGARMVEQAEDVWATDILVKVKEPQPSEYRLMQQGSTLFTYLHLAAEKALTIEMMARGVTGIA